jgi:acetyl esterase/lipase
MTTSELTADFVLTRHPYGSDPEQFGELRLPAQAGSGPFPSIVYVHGGGYRSQVTLAGAVGITSALTRLGYATWSIEYRRVGNGGEWPNIFDDVRAAASHLHKLAEDAPIDLSRVIVAGQSAGGQLALYLAKQRTGGNTALPDFRAVLALAPATDLRRSASNADSAVRALLGGGPEDVPERYAATSPLQLLPIGLPQLLVHGAADNTVPYALSEAYVAAAQAAGDAIELVTVEGADHLDLWNAGSTAFPTVVAAATKFLARASQ